MPPPHPTHTPHYPFTFVIYIQIGIVLLINNNIKGKRSEHLYRYLGQLSYKYTLIYKLTTIGLDIIRNNSAIPNSHPTHTHLLVRPVKLGCAFALLILPRTFIWKHTDTPRTLHLPRTQKRVLGKRWLKTPKTSCFTILGGPRSEDLNRPTLPYIWGHTSPRKYKQGKWGCIHMKSV